MSPAGKSEQNALSFLSDLIERARKAGADAADAVAFEGASLSVSQRLGNREDLERSEASDTGLRVLIGKQQAVVSSTDRSKEALDDLVERAVAMARAAPEDPHCGLADPAWLASETRALDLLDDDEPDVDALYERTSQAEDAARAVSGITNSEGAQANWSRSTVALATSGGFAGAYTGSRQGVAISVLAGEGTDMVRDYEYSSTRHIADLNDAGSTPEPA